jgi:hypothetical protein
LAGLGRKVFNSGDILLASEVQGYLQDQSVMVFEDAAARGSAIPSPTEGMVTFRKDDNALEVYDGAAFNPVGTEPGLVHIVTVTDSAVASISVNDCFSSTFNSYRINLKLLGSTTADADFRFRVAGADNSTSNYTTQVLVQNNTSVSSARGTGSFFGRVQRLDSSDENFGIMDIKNPFQALKPTGLGFISFGGASIEASYKAFYFNLTTSFTGFSILASTGTLTGSVSVYGYKE